MRLPKTAIENHQFTLVMIILLTALGLVSFFTMPRSEDPLVEFSGGNVIVVFPGAGPEDLEQLVVDPLEDEINELEDIDRLETTIQDGLAVVRVEFLYGTDPDEKYDELVQAVNQVRPDLPDGVASVETQEFKPSDVNILQLALVSETASYADLQDRAEKLETKLERVSGVKRVDTWAYPEQEVRVDLDLGKMREIGISLDEVVYAVQTASANIPGGHVEAGQRRFNVKTSGDFQSVDDIRRTVVYGSRDRVVYLKDIAEVQFDYEPETYIARYDGARAVFVTVLQRIGTNIFDVREGLSHEIEEFQTTLSDEIAMKVVFDQSDSVSYRVGGFFQNLLQGLLLVGLVVLLAMGFRASGIVVLAIPISLLMAIGWLDLSGFQLQQISIVGLVIALGLLVDNAIVVTENISRFIAMGESRLQAAIKGTSQMGWAIVTSTITTVLAFLPMVLLQTGTGDFVRSMPVTVIFALIASLIISLTLTPYLSSRFLSRRREGEERARRTPILQRFLRQQSSGPYRKSLAFALRRPVVVLVLAVVAFAGSLALFPFVGVSLFPKAEKPVFLVNIDAPQGTSLAHTDRIASDVETFLAARSEDVAHYATNVGKGNPRIYYNEWPKNETSSHAQVVVALADRSRSRMAGLIRDLRNTFTDYPGAEVRITEFAQGPPVQAPIAIRIVGEDIRVLRDLAANLETVIRQTPGTINVENPQARAQTDLHVRINRDKAGLLGVPLLTVDRTIRAGIAGLPVASIRDKSGDDHPIVFRLPAAGRPRISDLDQISVASTTGSSIPLRQVARIDFASGPNQIEHYGMERAATVTADVDEGFNVAAVTSGIVKQLDETPLPPGYRYAIAGEAESAGESFGGLGQALLVALLGIFGVLVLQFKSFRQPMIVFAAIPFAITGAILALLVTGYTFSFMAGIGLTSLVGIVVNNSIILVDYANQLRSDGKAVLEAIHQAGETRFAPIILTTLTTIGGLLPLTLQNSTLWSPMGWAIIGGLLMSTVLTLVVVPALYVVLSK
jgi:multidrug efflux pump subunit AcrB